MRSGDAAESASRGPALFSTLLDVEVESNAGWAFADRCQRAKVERVDVDEVSIVVADQRCVVPDRERGDDQCFLVAMMPRTFVSTK